MKPLVLLNSLDVVPVLHTLRTLYLPGCLSKEKKDHLKAAKIVFRFSADL